MHWASYVSQTTCNEQSNQQPFAVQMCQPLQSFTRVCCCYRSLFSLCHVDPDVPPEQRNVYSHFDITEEELRLRTIKQGNDNSAAAAAASSSSSSSASQLNSEEELTPQQLHHAIREAPSAASAAAAASSSATPFVFVKTEKMNDELSEPDAIRRAALGLQRLAQEEAEMIRRQLESLDQSWKKHI